MRARSEGEFRKDANLVRRAERCRRSTMAWGVDCDAFRSLKGCWDLNSNRFGWGDLELFEGESSDWQDGWTCSKQKRGMKFEAQFCGGGNGPVGFKNA